VTFAVLMLTVAVLSVLSLLGDLGWLEDAQEVAFGLLLLALFTVQLRERPTCGRRRALWCGVACALLLLVSSGIDAFV